MQMFFVLFWSYYGIVCEHFGLRNTALQGKSYKIQSVQIAWFPFSDSLHPPLFMSVSNAVYGQFVLVFRTYDFSEGSYYMNLFFYVTQPLFRGVTNFLTNLNQKGKIWILYFLYKFHFSLPHIEPLGLIFNVTSELTGGSIRLYF